MSVLVRGNLRHFGRDQLLKQSYICTRGLLIKKSEFKKYTMYLHGSCDAGTRLLFKFRSGTHGLNEELGRHGGREGKLECSICGAECESLVHVLWECPAYSSCREAFRLSSRS